MEFVVGTVVLDGWEIVRQIGEGAYGQVFEIQKTSFGVTTRSALKVIRIPQSQSDVKSALSEGMDEQSVTSYFRGFVDEIVHEIAIMSTLKSHPNIVSYEDHHIYEYPGEVRWDILIRMELLTPLVSYQMEHNLTEKETVRLGREIASALAYCQKKGLIHRDIKPENIFVSETGQFKLGDFGVARAAEKTSSGLSKKGTESYMAPEVYLGQSYGASVDIYSLGLVLYRFMNRNRLPFLPPAPQQITYEDRVNAKIRRMNGEAFPPPADADERLAAIILKACAFQSKDRYKSAVEMLRDLENYRPAEKKDDQKKEDDEASREDNGKENRKNNEKAGQENGGQAGAGNDYNAGKDSSEAEKTEGLFAGKGKYAGAGGNKDPYEAEKTEGLFAGKGKFAGAGAGAGAGMNHGTGAGMNQGVGAGTGSGAGSSGGSAGGFSGNKDPYETEKTEGLFAGKGKFAGAGAGAGMNHGAGAGTGTGVNAGQNSGFGTGASAGQNSGAGAASGQTDAGLHNADIYQTKTSAQPKPKSGKSKLPVIIAIAAVAAVAGIVMIMVIAGLFSGGGKRYWTHEKSRQVTGQDEQMMQAWEGVYRKMTSGLSLSYNVDYTSLDSVRKMCSSKGYTVNMDSNNKYGRILLPNSGGIFTDGYINLDYGGLGIFDNYTSVDFGIRDGADADIISQMDQLSILPGGVQFEDDVIDALGITQEMLDWTTEQGYLLYWTKGSDDYNIGWIWETGKQYPRLTLSCTQNAKGFSAYFDVTEDGRLMSASYSGENKYYPK